MSEYSLDGICPARYLVIVISPNPNARERGALPILYIFIILSISAMETIPSYALYCSSISRMFLSIRPGTPISPPHSLHTATVILKEYSTPLMILFMLCFFNVYPVFCLHIVQKSVLPFGVCCVILITPCSKNYLK